MHYSECNSPCFAWQRLQLQILLSSEPHCNDFTHWQAWKFWHNIDNSCTFRLLVASWHHLPQLTETLKSACTCVLQFLKGKIWWLNYSLLECILTNFQIWVSDEMNTYQTNSLANCVMLMSEKQLLKGSYLHRCVILGHDPHCFFIIFHNNDVTTGS